MFFAILFAVVLGFIFDCIAAFFCLLIAPFTGFETLDGLGFWNWFATVILAQILGSGTVAAARRS